MAAKKIPRRVFLKGIGVLLLVSGCSPDLLTVKPTVTPLPTAIPTPLPSADAVVQSYLDAWHKGNYEAMYYLLSPDSHTLISRAEFESHYNQAQTTATMQQVDTQIQSLLHDGPLGAATFVSIWHTSLFGSIQANNQMNLKFLDGRWGVEWQPTLVLPQLGNNVFLTFLSEQPTRGDIYDKNFHALATQGQMVTIGIIPQYMENEVAVVDNVSVITGVEPAKIFKKISEARPDWFVPIADISFEASLQVDNLLNNLPGVDRRARTVRTYNDGDIAAHIIGYIGSIPAEHKDLYVSQGYQGDELVGLSGIEAWTERQLAGRRGGRLVAMTSIPTSQVLSEIATVTSQTGSGVFLTIDTLFQAIVEDLLGERRGAIVVMDPHTGTIYAMAGYPRFNPAVLAAGFDADTWTELYTNPDRPLINRPTQGTYPPGSIFKTVSLTAALETIKLPPETSYVCTGKWTGLGQEFEKTCWLETGHGNINIIDGLTQSCNIVFYEVGLALHRNNPQTLPDWARAFGLGQPTNIFGLEESTGVIPDNAWKQANLNEPLFDGDAVNAAIGQGYTLVTPLQVAGMLAALGNGGKLIRPRIVDRILNVDGTEETFAPEVVNTLPISPENVTLIQNSLEDITSGARGTARHVFEGFSHTVAGKTGTAESGQEEPHAWFAGYSPADIPRVVIAVVLEHAGEGSKEAAPLFRQVTEAFFEWEANQT